MSKRLANSFAALEVHDGADDEEAHAADEAPPSQRALKRAEYRARKLLAAEAEDEGWLMACATRAPRPKQRRQQQQQQQQQQQHASGITSGQLEPADSLEAALQAIAEAEAHEQQQQQQQQCEPDEDEQLRWALQQSAADKEAAAAADSAPWGGAADEVDDDDLPALLQHLQEHEQRQHDKPLSGADALSWQRFALTFAAAARDAGDDGAAEGAVEFGLSTPLDLAALAADAAALDALGDAAAQAAAAGVSVEELLQAQQAELLLQANAHSSSSSRRTRANMQPPLRAWSELDWGSSSSAPSSPLLRHQHHPQQQQQQQQQAAAVGIDCQHAFPGLEPPRRPAASDQCASIGWQAVVSRRVPQQTAGRRPRGSQSPAAASAAPGGAGGIRVVQAACEAAEQWQLPRLSALDLHWDLRMEGLVQRQRSGGGGAAGGGSSGDEALAGQRQQQQVTEQAAAAQRTRELLADQQAGDAAAAGGTSTRDRLAADTVWHMYEKAGSRKGARAAAAAAAAAAQGSGGPDDPAGSGSDDDGGGMRGAKSACGYSWSRVFKAALAGGWTPVGKGEGAGGKHFKLRRVLPLSGVTQTLMMACTPSDAMRGPRNAAAVLLQRDHERDHLERQAAAAAAAGSGSAAAAAAGSRR